MRRARGHGIVRAMAHEPAIVMRGITKRFPGVVANDAVDFDAAAGEVHALLGENGAGKTTLMNILTGLYRPDEGDILVDGRPVSFRAPRNAIEAGIGMVHQHFRLVESLTVAENVLLGWHTPRLWLGRKAGIRQVAELAERYRMHVHPEARIWQLSVGEQQRVMLARALALEPDVLLLDEPTSALDEAARDAVEQTLLGLRHELDLSYVLVTHDLGQAARLADWVLRLELGGVAIGEGTTAELLRA